jgi:hypothetical protein
MGSQTYGLAVVRRVFGTEGKSETDSTDFPGTRPSSPYG